MKRNRRFEEEVHSDRWLISYSDFITLLFAFFVVLFAATYRDNQAIRKLSQAIHQGFQTMGAFSAGQEGYSNPDSREAAHPNQSIPSSQTDAKPSKDASATPPIDVVKLRRELEAVVGKELQDQEIAIKVTPEGFVISLRELGFFDSGQARLVPGAADKLARIAKVLAKPGLELRVEGHTDNQPIHNAEFDSNWELSTARATSVLLMLVNGNHIDPRHISASGYGEFRPVGDNSTLEGRRANRRVDLVVVQSRP